MSRPVPAFNIILEITCVRLRQIQHHMSATAAHGLSAVEQLQRPLNRVQQPREGQHGIEVLTALLHLEKIWQQSADL